MLKLRVRPVRLWVTRQSRGIAGRCSKTHRLRTKCGGMTPMSVAAMIATLAAQASIDVVGQFLPSPKMDVPRTF